MFDNDALGDDRLTADVSGPSKPPVLHTPASQLGARLSNKFKAAAFVLIGLVGAGMMIGVLTSGNNSSKEDGKADASTAMVGKTEPDTGAMQRIALENRIKELNNLSPNNSQRTSLENQGLNQIQNGQRSSLKSSFGNAGAQSTSGVQSAAENFQNWRQEQYYKSEEARFSAAQSAKNSTPFINISTQGVKQNSSDTLTSTTRTSAAINLDGDPGKLNTLATDIARLNANSANGGVGPNGVYSQSQNTSFLSDQKKLEHGYLSGTVNTPLAQEELFAGSLIPAVTTAGINSDLPGTVTAMVRQTVYDSRNEHIVLIPQGTRIIGQYSSSVSYGQQRVLVAWNRLIFPNGSNIDLQGMSGADGLGQAGLYDFVDNHYFRIFGSAMLVSMLGVAAQLSQPQNSSVLVSPSLSTQATGSATAQLNTVGTNLLNKNLNIAPTLVIAPGFAFNVMVNKTMILPAYK